MAFYGDAWRVDGVRIEPTGSSTVGLEPGDVVLALAERSIGDWIDLAADPGIDRSMFEAGQPIRYRVERSGSVLDVPVVLAPADAGPLVVTYWSAIVFTIVLQVVAAFVLWRRPGHSAAIALMLVACGVTGSTIPWLLGMELVDIARGWPFLLYLVTAAGLYMILWPAGGLHLPLAFVAGPAGPGRRRLATIYAIPLGSYVGLMITSRMLSSTSTEWLGTWPVVQSVVIVPVIVASMVLLVRGYWAATPETRRTLRWAMWGGILATLPSLALLFGPQLLLGAPLIPWSAVGLFALPLPVGIAVGILRDRLFDIEVIVRRTLVYGGATLVILATYAVSAGVLGSLLPIQGGFPAQLLATGIAALAALPARDVLQRAVGRVMFGDRDDPLRALGRLGKRLEATLDPVAAPGVIVGTVAESLRLPWVALRLGSSTDEDGLTFEHGTRPPGEVVAVPLISGAEIVGGLLVAPRSPGEPLSPADRAVLEALARQAGPAVHAMRLTLDLLASRERLVAAREEERRRIRRDLHDGLGPTLAAVGMRAELAAELAARDPGAAERVLGELQTEVKEALADIRRLVDALRPPALDELGLVGALDAQAARFGSSPAMTVSANGPLPELPAAVEVAAYRIAAEAMTNAARHSGARTCAIRLAAMNGSAGRALALEIVDDGRGLRRGEHPGIGLASMRERAAEVGGSLEVAIGPNGGTQVRAWLPLDESTTRRP